jgi:hypothetical protein
MVKPTNRLIGVINTCIDDLAFYEDKVLDYAWSELHRDFLKFCLVCGVISERRLRNMVQQRLVDYGRICYEQHIKSFRLFCRTRRYPDHVDSPHALAFAIRAGEFLPHELKKIRFDHGENIATFMPDVDINLVDHVVQQLLEWEPIDFFKL